MYLFPSQAFRDYVKGRTVELVPLLEVTLADGATGYMSDRRVVTKVAGAAGPEDRVYVRRLKSWRGASQDDQGSSSSASFTLSNIDRVMELASRNHNFFRGEATLLAYAPSLFADGYSFEDSAHVIWSGWISTTRYSKTEFTLECKDGLFSLSRPFPKRRFMRNCPHEFDDGCYCPYSGYGYQQKRNADGSFDLGNYVPIEDLQGVVGPAGETFVEGGGGSPNGSADFGPAPQFSGDAAVREGAAARPGYDSCDKTFEACFLRGMQRFHGGLRWISAWASGTSQQGFMGRVFKSGDHYTTVSTPNDTIYNQAVPMVYCAAWDMPKNPVTGVAPTDSGGTGAGFITTPVLFQWRYEDTYTAVEGIVSLGRLGKASDSTNLGYFTNQEMFKQHGGAVTFGFSGTPNYVAPQPPGTRQGEDVEGIKEIYVNGLSPHGDGSFGNAPLQFPPKPGFGVSRSTGRIGEILLWEQIGGDLRQAGTWTNPITGEQEKQPIIYLSQMAGFFSRVFDKESGINNPQVYNTSQSGGQSNKYAGKGAPEARVRIGDGRYAWRYFGPDLRVYQPTSNPSWVALDVLLEACMMKYSSLARHGRIADLQSFSDFAEYCAESVPNIVNPVYSTRRWLWSGAFTELKPAVDQIDSVLKDGYAVRVWRGKKLAVRPLTAGNFESDNTERPAFQEFVNIIDDSFEPFSPQPAYNSLSLNFADVDFDFQKNTATIYSESHQKFFAGDTGRMELSKSENLMGTPTTDCATRLGARMLKDTLGGVTREQWARLREYQVKTTFMMGELEVGDITYIAHTLCPDGGQWVRVKKKEWNSDWSITYSVRTFQIANYDDTVIGVASVELAQFGYNPYIPGSGGAAYAPLPALLWADEIDPAPALAVDAIPNVGIILHWLPYRRNPAYTPEEADALDRLCLATQLYRTDAIKLQKDLAADDTTAFLRYTLHLAKPPFRLRFDSEDGHEFVDVTAIDHSDRSVTITRGAGGTTPRAYTKGQMAYQTLYAGGFLAEGVSKTSTTWMVDTTTADFAVGERYIVNGERVLVTDVYTQDGGAPLHATLTFIVVTRAQKFDPADPDELDPLPHTHHKFAQLQHESFLDQTPDVRTAQFGTRNIFDYVDPWESGSNTETTTTTTTSTTTTATTTAPF